MYIQTRVVKVLPIHGFKSPLEAYRVLREHNAFGVLASVRYAYWLVYGNSAFPPGEFAAWANAQIEQHPYAIGVTLGICGYLLIMWILWMIVPHGYFGRW